MSDLVERLRESAVELMEGDGLIEDVRDLLHAAERIEQLEAQVARMAHDALTSRLEWAKALEEERAQADRLAVLLYSHSQGILGTYGDDAAIADYRKARGL